MGQMYLSFKKIIMLFLSVWITVIQGQINDNRNQSLAANIGQSFFFYDHPQYPRDCEEVRLQCSAADSSGVYVIKPDGYADAFEIYCDNNIDGGGWTVVQRRTEGTIDFLRGWEDYKEGFGFLWNEFWIGFEKLSFLTNQKKYNIRIDMEDATGSLFYIQYDIFRTSDENGDFRITRLGEYSGTAIIPESAYGACPLFMTLGNCTCQKTCQDPEGLLCQTTCSEGVGCICEDGFLKRGEECVLPEKCGCFVEGEGFIQNDQWYVNVNCSSSCQCHLNVLTCDNNYRCSSDATCEERDGVRQCYCNDGYTGDGQNCEATATDCADIYKAGFTDSGVYNIKPPNWPGFPFEVYCNMSEREGWTVFQRRVDGSQDFYVGWNMYKAGFGSPNHELWLGNDKLYYMTNNKNYQLRIDLVDRDGNQYYRRYTLFRISDERDDYTLVELGRSYGNTGYDSLNWHENKPFSTYDRDNDGWYNYAQRHRAGWWFGEGYTYTSSYCETREGYCNSWPFGGDSCGWCGYANLNGDYGSPVHGTNIHWSGLSGYDCNIIYSEMKLIRPS
ncbi:Ficolin-1 [Holothuria leucospilota]|uniref:Ficolin-1 n=1 Tax=Holothuria leucospilota TaxID=206669 RepID=A0A9Q1BUT7_HOLLE|nr:Ficolin-1 [Holothuria leucospilota]